MNRTLAHADRHSGTALKLLLAVNFLFFFSFVATLLFASAQARAAIAACTGTDLLATFQAEEGTRYAEIQAEAAKTLNGKGLLWKMEKDGRPASYLFGTMHMTDPRVTSLTPSAQQAFKVSRTLVIETTDVLDQSKMMEALVRQPDLMMFTDGTTLTSLISPEERALLEKGLSDRGIPLGSVDKMKPWMLAAMVALPACEMARKAGGAPVLDVKLAEDAKELGKTLEGLETAADQLGAMASLPMSFHIRGLIDTLRIGDRMDDVMETMIVLYEREDIGMVVPLIKAATKDSGANNEGYAEFEQTMVTTRNVTMATKAETVLADGGAFIAVGALHLPGPEGLVELFRKAGYKVTPAD